MTKRFLMGLALVTTCAGPAVAQTETTAADKDNPTAYTALRLISKTLGHDALDRVVEVTGHNGVPQPFLWKVILKEGTGSKEIDVAGGKISSQRALDRPPASSAPIKLADLNLDSSGAFDAIDVQARKVKLRYDSLDYVLRVSAESGKPVWTINLLDQGGSEVGSARLAAHDGSTLSTDGRLASNPLPPGTGASTTTTTTVRPRSVAEARETPRPPTREHSTVSTTVVRTTTAPPPPPQEIPVARLSDHEVDQEEHTEVTTTTSGESGGLFTRAGRTLDHTSQTVEKHLRRTGSKIQRFFTGGRNGGDSDEEEGRD